MAGRRQNDFVDGDCISANLKTPPSWTPENESHYSFSSWLADVRMWAAATDIDEDRLGSAVALRLGGGARSIAREMSEQLVDGMDELVAADGTVQHVNGLGLLLRALIRRFGPLEVEQSVKAISEFLFLRRQAGERIDSFLARFEVKRHRAETVGNIVLNHVLLSWLLLTAMQLPASSWSTALSANDGNLPRDAAEFTRLTGYLRRTMHLFEPGDHNLSRLGASNHRTTYHLGSGSSSEGSSPSPWDVHDQNAAASGGDSWPQDESWSSDNWSNWWAQDDQLYGSDVNDSDTESDVCEAEVDWSSYATMPSDAMGAEIFHEYMMARRRWRQYTGRGPRRFRAKGKGKGRSGGFKPRSGFGGGFGGGFGSGGFKGGRTYGVSESDSSQAWAADFLPGNSLAGGKG